MTVTPAGRRSPPECRRSGVFRHRSDLPEARATLERQANWLKQFTNYPTASKAIATSAARGNTTWRSANAAPLPPRGAGEGHPATRIKTISYGKERPADTGHDEAAWAKNRRAVTTLE